MNDVEKKDIASRCKVYYFCNLDIPSELIKSIVPWKVTKAEPAVTKMLEAHALRKELKKQLDSMWTGVPRHVN